MQLVEHSIDGIAGAAAKELARGNEYELLAKLGVIDIDLGPLEHGSDSFG
jgi:hypothetical protein